jgi:hypothetical protein
MAKQKASKVEAIITSKPKQAKASQALADKMLVSLKATLQDTGLTLTPEQLESIKSQQQQEGLVASSSRTKYTGEAIDAFREELDTLMDKHSDNKGNIKTDQGTFALKSWVKLEKAK